MMKKTASRSRHKKDKQDINQANTEDVPENSILEECIGNENVTSKKRNTLHREDDEQKHKAKYKSRLSLSFDSTKTNKAQNSRSQGSITSFFNNISPNSRGLENCNSELKAAESNLKENVTVEIRSQESVIAVDSDCCSSGENKIDNCDSPKESHTKKQKVKRKKNNIQENNKSDLVSCTKSPKECKAVRFSRDIREYSPEQVNRAYTASTDELAGTSYKNETIKDAYLSNENENRQSDDVSKTNIENVFTFMMNSRHKSIGQNSTGKELENVDENLEIKKETKRKLSTRKKLLEEWADAKGAKKMKLEDEEKGVIIRKKLKIRAKRLKKMLTNTPLSDENNKDDNIFVKKKRTRILESDSECSNDSTKLVTEEPRIVKKKNGKTRTNKLNNGVLVAPNKKYGKHESNQKTDLATSKLNLKSNTNVSNSNKCMQSSVNEENNKLISDDENATDAKVQTQEKSSKTSTCMTLRTAKQWKMKLKYDAKNECELSENANTSDGLDADSDDEPLMVIQQRLPDQKTETKKHIKLAPIFMKSKPDKETVEARRKFLNSGIPDSLKKIMEKQQSWEELEHQIFPEISHVRVKPTEEELIYSAVNFWKLPEVALKLKVEEINTEHGLLSLGEVTLCKVALNPASEIHPLDRSFNMKYQLRHIKKENLDYPIYKSFKYLNQKHAKIVQQQVDENTAKQKKTKQFKNSKKRRSKTVDSEMKVVEFKEQNCLKGQLWTELYKPCSSEEIFGNHRNISRIKTWLQTWSEFGEELCNQKHRKKRRNSDSSDFEDSDIDSRDSTGQIDNAIILSGPLGSGKTNAVYALCNELGINVLELNASSKRTGKRLLQELQEATQSHQVRQNGSNHLNTFLKSTELESQPNGEEQIISSNKMCVLLIEDIDIVFDQDENFISALNQLLASSKRPIVLTTTDSNCQHLKKFSSQYSTITFSPLSTKVMTGWLQTLCLIEGVYVDRQEIINLLENNGGDIRHTLMQLQFWVQSGGQPLHTDTVVPTTRNFDSINNEIEIQDDSSNSSWLNKYDSIGEQEIIKHGGCLKSLGYSSERELEFFALNLNSVWNKLLNVFKLPSYLIENKTKHLLTQESSNKGLLKSKDIFFKKGDSGIEIENLRKMLDTFECLVLTDIGYKKLYIGDDSVPAKRNYLLKNSLELKEYMTNYSLSRDLLCDWTSSLINGSTDSFNVNKTDEYYTGAELKRIQSAQNICDDKFLDVIPFACQLDRNSVDMDYLSSLRTMARSELVRVSNKRNNRFYNYLQGLNISYDDKVLSTAYNVFQRN